MIKTLVMVSEVEPFNEQTLRAEIIKTWGPAGAHIDVYDGLLKRAGVRAGIPGKKPEWLDEETITEVKRLWNIKNENKLNPRVKAIMLIREKADESGYKIDLKKAVKIKEEFCSEIRLEPRT